jgi:hypothetical protein
MRKVRFDQCFPILYYHNVRKPDRERNAMHQGGDLLVTENGEGGESFRAILFVDEDGSFLVGEDEDMDYRFVPLPYIYEIKDGLLLGGPEALAVKGIVPEGAMEIYRQYVELSELADKADTHAASHEESTGVSEQNEKTVEVIEVLTLYCPEMDGAARAVALFETIGIPLPDREKLILLGIALDNLELSALDFVIPEEDEEDEDPEDQGSKLVIFLPEGIAANASVLRSLVEDIDVLILGAKFATRTETDDAANEAETIDDLTPQEEDRPLIVDEAPFEGV